MSMCWSRDVICKDASLGGLYLEGRKVGRREAGKKEARR